MSDSALLFEASGLQVAAVARPEDGGDCANADVGAVPWPESGMYFSLRGGQRLGVMATLAERPRWIALMDALRGAAPVAAGEITLQGRDGSPPVRIGPGAMGRQRARLATRVHPLATSPAGAFDPSRTFEENLRPFLARRTRETAGRRQGDWTVETALRAVGLDPGWARLYPAQAPPCLALLAALARAVATGADVLLLDDTTLDLDLFERALYLDTLAHLQHCMGFALVVATYDSDLGPVFFDHLWTCEAAREETIPTFPHDGGIPCT